MLTSQDSGRWFGIVTIEFLERRDKQLMRHSSKKGQGSNRYQSLVSEMFWDLISYVNPVRARPCEKERCIYFGAWHGIIFSKTWLAP
jgi:hypothetical protein